MRKLCGTVKINKNECILEYRCVFRISVVNFSFYLSIRLFDSSMGKFACKVCTAVYTQNANLRKHVKKAHPEKLKELATCSKAQVSTLREYACDECDILFTSKRGLRLHKSKKHDVTLPGRMQQCPLCPLSDTKNQLLAHMSIVHEVAFMRENIEFSNIDSYKKWKLGIERKSKREYISDSSFFKNSDGTSYQTFHCHPLPFSERQKSTKRRHKNTVYCPSSFHLTICDDDKCKIAVINTHVGHDVVHDSFLQCSLCSLEFCLTRLSEHLAVSHDIILERVNLELSDFSDFKKWKNGIEDDPKHKYIIKEVVGENDGSISYRYFCHQFENLPSKIVDSKDMREIQPYCPANIHMSLKTDGKCSISFLKTHIGHTTIKDIYLKRLKQEFMIYTIESKQCIVQNISDENSFDLVSLPKDTSQETTATSEDASASNFGLDSKLFMVATDSDMVVEVNPSSFVPPEVDVVEIDPLSQPGPSSRVEPDSSMVEDASKAGHVTVKIEPDSHSSTVKIKQEPPDDLGILSATVEKELNHFTRDTAMLGGEESLFQPPALIKDEIESEEEM